MIVLIITEKLRLRFDRKEITSKKDFGQMELKKMRILEFFFFFFLACPPIFPYKNYDPPHQSFLVGQEVCLNRVYLGKFFIHTLLFENCEEKIGHVIAVDHTYRVQSEMS